jgi:hypothetical protein
MGVILAEVYSHYDLSTFQTKRAVFRRLGRKKHAFSLSWRAAPADSTVGAVRIGVFGVKCAPSSMVHTLRRTMYSKEDTVESSGSEVFPNRLPASGPRAPGMRGVKITSPCVGTSTSSHFRSAHRDSSSNLGLSNAFILNAAGVDIRSPWNHTELACCVQCFWTMSAAGSLFAAFASGLLHDPDVVEEHCKLSDAICVQSLWEPPGGTNTNR